MRSARSFCGRATATYGSPVSLRRRTPASTFTLSTPLRRKPPTCSGKVTQPLLGEMRLQWWVDALEGAAAPGEGARAQSPG